LLLSSEEFSRLPPSWVEEFTAMFQGLEVRPILTLAPFGGRAVSFWQEQVKWGETRPLEAALPGIVRERIFLPDFLEELGEAFEGPPPAVLVVNPAGDPRQLFRHFQEATGIPELLDDEEPPPRLNQSLGRLEVEVLRGLGVGVLAVHGEGALARQRRCRDALLATFQSPEWREAGPRTPIQMPEAWRAPLGERVRDFLDRVGELADTGAIEVFGDLEDLDDLGS
jgi:hypothetical protein